jgi:hypothetical protein
LEEERRNSERIKVEMPISFEIGKNTFFGTTANLSDDGMMIESSLAPENVRRIFKALLKIKHYHLDFSGSESACRFSFGVWIPKLKIRDEKGL